MTREQKISLRDALDADLNGKPVQWRVVRMDDNGPWNDIKTPFFNTETSGTREPIEWRPKPPEPQPMIVRYASLKPDGTVHGIWGESELAEDSARDLKSSVVKLVEASRVSFADKPKDLLHVLVIVRPDGVPAPGWAWTLGDRDAAQRVADANTGYRVAEFVEVVK